jgi:cytochrome c biogenesis protein CcdA
MKIKNILLIFVILLMIIPLVNAASIDDASCAVYFTGIGCPHCAKVDPVLFEETLPQHNLVIIEYEVYQKKVNAPLIYTYNENYETALGIPQIITNANLYYAGDKSIIEQIDNYEKSSAFSDNTCTLPNSTVELNDLDFNELQGQPTLWYQNKVLIKTSNNITSSDTLKQLLNSELNEATIDSILNIDYDFIEAEEIQLSGTSMEFDNALQLKGWILQWKDIDKITPTGEKDNNENVQSITQQVTLWEVVSLALVDAVNPCALAVLTMILLSIITYNPNKKKTILYSGLAFVAAVIIMYLIYGIVIIKFFQLIQAITSVRLILYKVLGVVAIGLGLLQIKDFITYKAGSFATEMPLSFRPKIKRLISKVTSPKGAFVIGLFVTLFLLPCTIGPYVIMGGILSAFAILKTLPLLLLYNLIFVLPMLAITLFVYFGVSKIDDISAWKDKNTKILHLVAGTIIFLLGIAMLFGFV